MNPLVRRRLPPSVRRLLTDVGPKEEWTESEPDTVSRDGILLPTRGGAASGEEEFLTPAQTAAKEDVKSRSSVCMLCKQKPSSYTCPRCNLQYCGVACYQSPAHAVCSEEFYKESVLQELKMMGKTDHDGRQKMQEVLVGLRRQAERTAGGMESLLKDSGVVSDDDGDEGEGATAQKVQAVQLLSRLAELQQSGEGSTTEVEAILRKLEEIGGGELPPGDRDEDADSPENELDLADRLSDMDIDKLSEEELWELLNNKEKETFLSLLRGGALGGLVPLWTPWWEEHEEGGLVEVLEERGRKLERGNSTTMDELDMDNKVETSQELVQEMCKSRTKLRTAERENKEEKGEEGGTASTIPAISAKIPKLSSLCANPSPLVCYGLVNALFAYTFTVCRLNNDTDSLMFEFCDTVLALSEALNSSRVFSSVQEAVDRGETLITGGGYLDKEDPLASDRAVEAVAHIMTGRNRRDATGYCLAALSQLRSVLSKARTTLSKDGDEGGKRKTYFLASKKCEFFQAWVLDNALQIHTLAIELWSEHGRRRSLRSGMEKAKTVVEENLKKGKKTANVKLIEELS